MKLKIISILLVINVLFIASNECFPIYLRTLKKLLVPVAVAGSALGFVGYGVALEASKKKFEHSDHDIGHDFGHDDHDLWGGLRGFKIKLDKDNDWLF